MPERQRSNCQSYAPNKIYYSYDQNYSFYQMKSKLADEALSKIQNLIVQKEPTPKKQKSSKSFVPSRIVEENQRDKSPKSKPANSSPLKNKTPSVYIPRQRQIRLLQKQTKMIYNQLEQQVNYRIQNPHSFFLNQKNPKPPLYQRAQEIVRQRQAFMEEKRQQKLREKQEAQQRQYQQFLKQQASKKVISKEQAAKISDRLYKDHYSKTNRLNQQKINRYKQQSKFYRDKPEINKVSKQIYEVIAEKNQLQADIINRFGQYEVKKSFKQKETVEHHKNKYFPFKPQISDNSRVINSARKSIDLSKSSHCLSCNFIKSQFVISPVSKSPSNRNYFGRTQEKGKSSRQ